MKQPRGPYPARKEPEAVTSHISRCEQSAKRTSTANSAIRIRQTHMPASGKSGNILKRVFSAARARGRAQSGSARIAINIDLREENSRPSPGGRPAACRVAGPACRGHGWPRAQALAGPRRHAGQARIPRESHTEKATRAAGRKSHRDEAPEGQAGTSRRQAADQPVPGRLTPVRTGRCQPSGWSDERTPPQVQLPDGAARAVRPPASHGRGELDPGPRFRIPVNGTRTRGGDLAETGYGWQARAQRLVTTVPASRPRAPGGRTPTPPLPSLCVVPAGLAGCHAGCHVTCHNRRSYRGK